uniref:Uncharacterized protein n=1 Tax=viral metagenome TaxID=1070528 RepID=A0A6H1ZWP2_9ZZZZ
MQTMYIFELGRLVGVQDVTNWPVEMIDRTLAGLVMCRRTGEVSDKGRGICCVCQKDLGERELPSGRLSHGLCDRAECKEAKHETS